MPRILGFCEHSVYCTGLRSLIGANIPGAEVIEANSLIQASSYIRNGVFDLMLAGIDLSSSALDPLKAARATSPTTRFAVISASDTRADILAILAAGFHGFISKHQSDTDILAAVSDILSGRIYVPSPPTKYRWRVAKASTRRPWAAIASCARTIAGLPGPGRAARPARIPWSAACTTNMCESEFFGTYNTPPARRPLTPYRSYKPLVRWASAG